jgi:hypothetical protein
MFRSSSASLTLVDAYVQEATAATLILGILMLSSAPLPLLMLVNAYVQEATLILLNAYVQKPTAASLMLVNAYVQKPLQAH